MSDEPPTVPLPTEPATPPPGPPAGRGRGRGQLVVIIVLAVLVVAAVAVILWQLLHGPSASETAAPTASATSSTPTASSTPSATPSTTPTEPGDDGNGAGGNGGSSGGNGSGSGSGSGNSGSSNPTADGAPVFTSLSIPNATCGPERTGTSPVTIQYTSDGATQAFFGINVVNAAAAPSAGPLPVNGPFTFDYQCSEDSQLWTMTLVDGAGGTTNKSVTVSRTPPQ